MSPPLAELLFWNSILFCILWQSLASGTTREVLIAGWFIQLSSTFTWPSNNKITALWIILFPRPKLFLLLLYFFSSHSVPLVRDQLLDCTKGGLNIQSLLHINWHEMVGRWSFFLYLDLTAKNPESKTNGTVLSCSLKMVV